MVAVTFPWTGSNDAFQLFMFSLSFQARSFQHPWTYLLCNILLLLHSKQLVRLLLKTHQHFNDGGAFENGGVGGMLSQRTLVYTRLAKVSSFSADFCTFLFAYSTSLHWTP